MPAADCWGLVSPTPGSSRGHELLRFPSTATLAAVVQRLKGASSYECNQRGLLPARLRWQRGYWAQSVGPDAVVPLIQYLATQREHHACHPMNVLFNARGLAGSAVLLDLTVLAKARTVRFAESDAVCCEPAAGGLEVP